MPKSFKERRKILKNANYLDLTPVKSFDHKTNDDGTIGIVVPKFQSDFAKKFLKSFSRTPSFNINLDKFGSESWLLIDGQKKVGKIGEELIKIFGEEIKPVEERLTKFLTTLYEQRLISFKEIE